MVYLSHRISSSLHHFIIILKVHRANKGNIMLGHHVSFSFLPQSISTYKQYHSKAGPAQDKNSTKQEVLPQATRTSPPSCQGQTATGALSSASHTENTTWLLAIRQSWTAPAEFSHTGVPHSEHFISYKQKGSIQKAWLRAFESLNKRSLSARHYYYYYIHYVDQLCSVIVFKKANTKPYLGP